MPILIFVDTLYSVHFSILIFNNTVQVYAKKKKRPDDGVFKPKLVARLDKQTLHVVFWMNS